MRTCEGRGVYLRKDNRDFIQQYLKERDQLEINTEFEGGIGQEGDIQALRKMSVMRGSHAFENSTDSFKEERRELPIAAGDKVVLSEEILRRLGVEDASSLRIIDCGDKIEIHPSIHNLSKLYIEPTSNCNLDCQTCIRKTWQEPLGDMDIEVFESLIDQMKDFRSIRSVMFGGFGEPTYHPDILYMIQRVKSLGLQAEMVTNGTLLDEKMLQGLLESKLDTLWVSFDGTSEENFDDIRAGASFSKLVQNLQLLDSLNKKSSHKIKVGIAFVVMKRNIHELSNLGSLAERVKARMISVSNVIPYSKSMLDQMVCDRLVNNTNLEYGIPIDIPLIDYTEETKQYLFELFRDYNNIRIMKNKIRPEVGSCRFIKERCSFVRWDGAVSPCMGLLHSHKSYFIIGEVEREVTHYALGNIKEKRLKEIWDSEEYHDFRERVDFFGFSPCLRCGPCLMAEKNQEDCFGNLFPTCGGCLWAQGVIQCP